MKHRIQFILTALAIGNMCAMGQFSVTMNGSGEKKIVADGSIVSTGSVPTFGGIPVDRISEVTSSGLAQDAAGTVVTLPENVVWQKPAAVLDITSILNENESEKRNVYSAEYMLDIAGLPNFTTTSLDEALAGSGMIIISSNVKKSTFSSSDVEKMRLFVEEGGSSFLRLWPTTCRMK